MNVKATEVLDQLGISYRLIQHSRPVLTVKQAAQERGVRAGQVVKTMVVRKSDGSYVLVLLPGDCRLHFAGLGRRIGDPQVRLATRAEVSEITGCPVGAVTPLTAISKGLDVLFDERLLEVRWVTISSGHVDAGILLSSSDLLSALAAPVVDVAECPRGQE